MPITSAPPSRRWAPQPSFPIIRRVQPSSRLTSTSTRSVTSSNAASQSSSSSDESQPDTRKPRGTSSQSSLSQLQSYGSDKCPHDLRRFGALRDSLLGSLLRG